MLPNKAMTKAGLTLKSGSYNVYSTSAFALSLHGKMYTSGAVSDGTTPTTDGNTGAAITLSANFGMVVVWASNSSGTHTCYKGTTTALDSAGNFITYPQFPILPDTVAPFAYTVHKAGSTTSGTWTFGTSNWNATGMTNAVVDVTELPARPQVS